MIPITNRDIDVEKIHEIIFDCCDISNMEEPVSLASHRSPPNMDTKVPKEDCDTYAEEMIKNVQENLDTEQSNTGVIFVFNFVMFFL